MSIHHTQDEICPLCTQKIAEAHPTLQLWWGKIKAKFPDAHVSWSFRDEANQNTFFQSGKTLARWPHSAHNKEPAQAMDLFQLREDNVASWQRSFFQGIADWLKAQGCPLTWAGDWERFREFDHFQMDEPQGKVSP